MNHGFCWLTILGQFSLWSISAVPVLYSYLQCFLCSYKFLYGPYLLNWVWAAVQADGPTQQSIGHNWPCETWIGLRMEAFWKYTMEGLGDFGLLVNKVGQDNVYQNLLASIDRENLSVFWNFLIRATIPEISLKNGVWGPVEWVGDQLTGWGGSTRN